MKICLKQWKNEVRVIATVLIERQQNEFKNTLVILGSPRSNLTYD
jgi:hypothetical protein